MQELINLLQSLSNNSVNIDSITFTVKFKDGAGSETLVQTTQPPKPQIPQEMLDESF